MILDMDLATWEEKKAEYISEMESLLGSSQVVVTAREGRRSSPPPEATTSAHSEHT